MLCGPNRMLLRTEYSPQSGRDLLCPLSVALTVLWQLLDIRIVINRFEHTKAGLKNVFPVYISW